MNIYLSVFIGGGLGSLSRLVLTSLTSSNFKNINPQGTLLANISATLILGVAVYFFGQKGALSAPLRAFLITGFCGGFSTFSTFSYETYELLRTHNYWYAFANIFISILMCLLLLWIIYSFSEKA